MSKKIIITGGAGLIGFHLAKKLIKKNIKLLYGITYQEVK